MNQLQLFLFFQLWEFAAHLFPAQKEAIENIRHNKDLPDVPVATPPALTTARGGGIKVVQYVEKVQKYLVRLTYNHTGTALGEQLHILWWSDCTLYCK